MKTRPDGAPPTNSRDDWPAEPVFGEHRGQLLAVHNLDAVRLEDRDKKIRKLLGTRSGDLPKRHFLALERDAGSGRMVDGDRHSWLLEADDLAPGRAGHRQQADDARRDTKNNRWRKPPGVHDLHCSPSFETEFIRSNQRPRRARP
jgi:hypothetical protein